MTTLEIILICIIVWLVGIVVVLWLDRVCKADLEEIFVIFLWFLAIPCCLIYHKFKGRKAPKHHGYDTDHACILKLPFGWEKLIIYRNLYFAGDFNEVEEFTEQDVAKVLKEGYKLSKGSIWYLRKTKQLTKVTNKLKEIHRQ